ncbi:hypothetical protein CPB97_007425 [Podila verticillata]|nr:hypothetical protein CPB97_007425 [Podila verticillata]
MPLTHAEMARGFLRPRFIIAFAALALLSYTTYTRLNMNNAHVRLGAIDNCPISNGNSVAGAIVTTKDRLLRSEKVYQQQVALRDPALKENGYGKPWFSIWPTAKDSMNWWGYFPASFNCPHEVERVGRYNDGGKWMCGMSVLENLDPSEKCVIYSMGVNDDSSWEAEMMDRTRCEVWAFDGSVEDVAGAAKGNPRMHFNKVFIGNENRVTADGSVWKTLPTIMKENGHEWIDVLKVDIEGYEYEAFDALMDSYQGSILPFSQLQVELHLLAGPFLSNDVRGFNKFKRWYERLESMHLRPFWHEHNLVPISVDYKVGFACIEYSFLNVAGNHRLLRA